MPEPDSLPGELASVPVEPLAPEAFRKALSTWYRRHARVLPWRGVRNPYATWLSEIMLQQTRVATVAERYQVFLRRFPTIEALAEAPEEAVLALWSGLGYYRRARMLHRAAQFVQRELEGELPRTAAELRRLPGIGEYTAAAIASIAFGQAVAVLDGNVERVLLRLLGLPEDRTAAGHSLLLEQANELVPQAPRRRGLSNPAGDHNQAVMELGATICLPRGPLCLQCPVMAFCRSRGEHRTAARKQLRSQRMACLLATRKRRTRTEVLLHRRAAEASLMAGMLELPPLALDTVEGLEPVLRVRHGITNTNYYAEIYAESSTDAAPMEESGEMDPEPESAEDEDVPLVADPVGEEMSGAMGLLFAPEAPDDPLNEDEEVFLATGSEVQRPAGLREQLPAAEADLLWVKTAALGGLPLTGLTRKVLQRLGLMPMQPVRLRGNRMV